MRDNDTRVNYLPVKRTQLKARASLHALYIPGLSMCFLPQYSCISQTFFGDQIPVAPYARSLYSLLTEWGGGAEISLHISHVVQFILPVSTCKPPEAMRHHDLSVLVHPHRIDALETFKEDLQRPRNIFDGEIS
jgi:hypothetical protein